GLQVEARAARAPLAIRQTGAQRGDAGRAAAVECIDAAPQARGEIAAALTTRLDARLAVVEHVAEAAARVARTGGLARGRIWRWRRAVGMTIVERAPAGVLRLRERIAAGLLAGGRIGVTGARRGARLERGLPLGEADATRAGT